MFTQISKLVISTLFCTMCFTELACDTEKFIYREPVQHEGYAGSAGSSESDQSSPGSSAGTNNGGSTGSVTGSNSFSASGSNTGGSRATGGSSSSVAGSPSAPCFTPDLTGIKLEADYILASQIATDPTDPAHGAIQHRPSNANTVIPSEVAMAGIGLMQASVALSDPLYRDRAVLAANYLTRTVDKIYGGWFDQYVGGSIPTNQPISVRQTAMTVIFLHKLGFNSTRATTVKNAGGFILAHAAVQNKGGADDGLVCKGRDAHGKFIGERWLHDNILCYQAMLMAASWHDTDGETANANELRTAAVKLKNGINAYLKDPANKNWKRMVDVSDAVPTEIASTVDWISYSPELFDFANSIPIATTGTAIHDALQLPTGGVAWDNGNYRARQSPLYSFQAALVWRRAGQCAYANSAMDWAKANAWRLTKDANGLTGGWLDWIETSGNKPNELERSVETSAYAILNWTSFSFAP